MKLRVLRREKYWISPLHLPWNPSYCLKVCNTFAELSAHLTTFFAALTETRSFTPKVSILTKGVVIFNSSARKDHKLDSFQSVKLGVIVENGVNKRIVFKFLSKDEPGCYRVKHSKNGVIVVAKDFLTRYGIEFAGTAQFDLVHDAKEKLLSIQLDHGKIIARQPGKGKKSVKFSAEPAESIELTV